MGKIGCFTGKSSRFDGKDEKKLDNLEENLG